MPSTSFVTLPLMSLMSVSVRFSRKAPRVKSTLLSTRSVPPLLSVLRDLVAEIVDRVGVAAVAAGHVVGALLAVDLVGAGVAGELVDAAVAGEVEGAGAGERGVLDVGVEGAEVEADGGDDGVGAAAVVDHVLDVVDDVGVVAGAAIHGVEAGAAVQAVVAGVADQAVVAGEADERVVAAHAEEGIGGGGAGDAVGGRCRCWR